MDVCDRIIPLSTIPNVVSINESFSESCTNERTLVLLNDITLLQTNLFLMYVSWIYDSDFRTDCSQTYIKVEIGSSFKQQFCDEKATFPLYSTHNNITITFKGNDHSIFKDIRINTSMIKAENYDVALRHTDCRETYFTNLSGLITSPNYPFGYIPSTCLYKIKVGMKKQIHLHVMDFMLIPSGYLCTQLDDNIRIRVADSFHSNFEYISDINEEQPFYCNTMENNHQIHLKDLEYLFIQFNTNRPTVIHRGFAFGYTVEDYSPTPMISHSSAVNIIIGTVVSVSAVISGSLLITFFLSKRKRRKIITVNTETKVSAVEHENEEETDGGNYDNLTPVKNSDSNTDDEELFANNLKRLRELYHMNNNSKEN